MSRLPQSAIKSIFLRRFAANLSFIGGPRPLRLTKAGELLFPVLRNGFDSFSAALAALPGAAGGETLRVTTPNAFASRWLVPRLPRWREVQPRIALEVIGTDRPLNLASEEADVAIRYARRMPTQHVAQELFRDSYFAICRAELLPQGKPLNQLADMCRLPRIHYDWMKNDAETKALARVAIHANLSTNAPARLNLTSPVNICSPVRGRIFVALL